MSVELVKYDAACQAIAAAKSVDEAKHFVNLSDAMRAYAKQSKNKALETDAAEIRIRATRRLGEIIRDQKATVGLNPGTRLKGGDTKSPAAVPGGSIIDPPDLPTLADVGIDKSLANQARKLSAVPAEQFEALVGEWRGRIEDETARVTTNLLREGDREETRIARPAVPLPTGVFRLLYVDPPWRYEHIVTESRAIENQYPTMSLEEISSLEVPAADDAVLFLWATSPKLAEAMAVIGCWGFCCGVGTRVLTQDLRWQPVETLVPGQTLLAFDEQPIGTRRYYRTAVVLANGVKDLPCVRITTNDGRSVICSEDHPWLVRAGSVGGKLNRMRWLRSTEIAKLMRHHNRKHPLTFPLLAPVQEPEFSYESGYLSAAFDGEGTIGHGKLGLVFSQKNNAMLRQVEAFLTARRFEFSRYEYDANPVAATHIRGGYEASLRFLMMCRPVRLLDRWLNNPDRNISIYNTEIHDVAIVDVEQIGIRPCAALTTSTGTYIAEGFGSHNTYRTCAVWDKERLGMGYYFRQQHELLLVAAKGALPVPEPSVRVSSVIRAPRGRHSEKPEVVYELLEAMYPTFTEVDRVELFARDTRAGWAAWTNEPAPVLEDLP